MSKKALTEIPISVVKISCQIFMSLRMRITLLLSLKPAHHHLLYSVAAFYNAALTV